MKIAVIGTGYVGLVGGVCLADFGFNVVCVDSNKEKIDKINMGEVPIYEHGLDSIMERNMYYKRLEFTTNIQQAVENSDVIFIAVGTPSAQDGSADLKCFLKVAQDVALYMNGYKVIVDKSTVPIGTGQKVKAVIQETLIARDVDYDFDVVSNPEFLREGTAIYDFTHPDRIVLGVESEKAEKIMKEVYRVLYINETPFLVCNIETAEMIKYASNAFLAMKITYINEVANLCEAIGADVQHVANAMGKDGRISPKFLHAGPGYGGSCFPKDTRAFAQIGMEYGLTMTLVEATIKANENQKHRMVKKVCEAMGDLTNKTIAVLGLTFKQNTDDMREAPSLVIIPELVKLGAKIKAYDPQSKKEGMWRFKDYEKEITLIENPYDAVNCADAVIILTEWNEFRGLDISKVKNKMTDTFFFDFRNLFSKESIIEFGFNYYGVGK
ncbi:MAG: UDP-glucose 6-dehydrogenase [Firmicutes bacterium HGW-Firmicutes-7]|nr:MAG: UDP-glucose 6-dehydrogenase [Firmicutes bacterium HGW-Firmicutes-7]